MTMITKEPTDSLIDLLVYCKNLKDIKVDFIFYH